MSGARPHSTTRSWLVWLGPIAGLLVLLWHNRVLQPWTLDDAYISMRYAENFANGHGLVYNPGERVEGYTTFLWVFLLGIGNALGLSTRWLAKALGLGLSVSTVVLVSQAWRFHPSISTRASGLAAGLLGSCGVFTAWAMPGMEVPLVAFLLTLTGLAMVRDARLQDAWMLAGGAGALAMMARPDSIVWVGVLCAGAAMRALARRDWRHLRAPLVVAGLYGPYFAWRFAYYGWLLPNTFYAKVGRSEAQVERGLEYVSDFLFWPSGALWLPVFLALPFAWTVWQRYQRDAGLGIWVVGLVLHGLYVVSVGGDVMPAFRFFSGVLPMLALCAGLAVAVWPRAVAWLVLIAGLGFNLWSFENDPDLHRRIERGVVGLRGEEVGLWLREHVDPDALLATNTAGSVAYFSGLRTLDMLGLNDAHIAHRQMPGMGKGRAGHEKADGAYVFSRLPDIVHMGSARGRAKPVFRSDRELFRQPGFRERYRVERVRLPSGARLVLWVRDDVELR